VGGGGGEFMLFSCEWCYTLFFQKILLKIILNFVLNYLDIP
jgi:hypothetical protein